MRRRSRAGRPSAGLVARSLALSFALSGIACHGGPTALHPTADSAIARLREQAHCSRAVQGEAALSYVGEGRRLSGRVLFLAAAPDRLRLDVVSPFGATLSTLTSDGTTFGLYDMEHKSFLFGPPTTCNVERFTQVPAPPSALVEILRGQAPVLRHGAERTEITWKRPLFGPGYYQVEVTGEHDAVEYLRVGVHPDDLAAPLAEQRLRLLRVEVLQGGESLYEVDLSGHSPATRAVVEMSAEEKALGLEPPRPSGPLCEAELPRTVRFFVPRSGNELTFKIEEVAHNPVLGADVFRQPTPGGVTVRQSVCR